MGFTFRAPREAPRRICVLVFRFIFMEFFSYEAVFYTVSFVSFLVIFSLILFLL